MKINFFSDFDGTLIDSSHRLYTLFCRLVPECQFSYDEYWELKRKKINQRDILSKYFQYSGEKIKLVHERWMSQVESPELLKLDKPLDGVTDALKNLSHHFDLYLVTARQDSSLVYSQLDRFSWRSYFKNILVTHQMGDKSALILENATVKTSDWIAGDTGEDILAGKSLAIGTIAVTSGTLSEDSLRPYKPDLIVNSIRDLKLDQLLPKVN